MSGSTPLINYSASGSTPSDTAVVSVPAIANLIPAFDANFDRLTV